MHMTSSSVLPTLGILKALLTSVLTPYLKSASEYLVPTRIFIKHMTCTPYLKSVSECLVPTRILFIKHMTCIVLVLSYQNGCCFEHSVRRAMPIEVTVWNTFKDYFWNKCLHHALTQIRQKDVFYIPHWRKIKARRGMLAHYTLAQCHPLVNSFAW